MSYIIFTDLETNGWASSSVLECCFLKYKYCKSLQTLVFVDKFHRYYFPQEKININAISKNGLSIDKIHEQRKSKNANYVKYFIEDKKDLKEFFGNSQHIIAHNINFDYSFVKKIKAFDFVFCTMNENINIVKAKRLDNKLKSPSLNESAKFYNIPIIEEKLHNAYYDTEICKDIFVKMLNDKCPKVLDFLENKYSSRVNKNITFKCNITENKSDLDVLFEMTSEKFDINEFSYHYHTKKLEKVFTPFDFKFDYPEQLEYKKQNSEEFILKQKIICNLLNMHSEYCSVKIEKIRLLIKSVLKNEFSFRKLLYYCPRLMHFKLELSSYVSKHSKTNKYNSVINSILEENREIFVLNEADGLFINDENIFTLLSNSIEMYVYQYSGLSEEYQIFYPVEKLIEKYHSLFLNEYKVGLLNKNINDYSNQTLTIIDLYSCLGYLINFCMRPESVYRFFIRQILKIEEQKRFKTDFLIFVMISEWDIIIDNEKYNNLNLITYMPKIIEIIKAMGYSIVSEYQIKPENVITTILNQANKQGMKVKVVTYNNIFNQLVKDDKVQLYKPIHDAIISESEILEKYKIRSHQFLDYLSLSENISGYHTIELLEEFSTLENILYNLDKINKKRLLELIKKYEEKILNDKQNYSLDRDSFIFNNKLYNYKLKENNIERVLFLTKT